MQEPSYFSAWKKDPSLWVYHLTTTMNRRRRRGGYAGGGYVHGLRYEADA